MRYTLRVAGRYKKDLKKYQNTLTENQKDKLKRVIGDLMLGSGLPETYKDHPLIGNWRGYRECHITPDLLLIYKIVETSAEVRLARLGSHSELFK